MMDWQKLELFLFIFSYVLFAVTYLWLALGEPLLRLRADWLAMKAEQAAQLAKNLSDSFPKGFHGVPPVFNEGEKAFVRHR